MTSCRRAVSSSLILLTAGLSLAAEIHPRGRPERLNKADAPPRAFFIWVDKDGWHLRTTSKGLHRYSGEISVVGGTFTDLKNANADARRRKRGGDGDRGHISDDKLQITFGMRTEADIDGFDFKVSDGAKTLKFRLLIDSDPANQKQILIGLKGENPENNIFEVPVVSIPK